MARRRHPVGLAAAEPSPLRQALAECWQRHADAWDTGRDDAIGAVLAGAPFVLDAPTLLRGLSHAGDNRWRDFRPIPNDERRWLLTESDQLIGPLTAGQLDELEGD